METSTLFTVGRLRGIKTASILNNVVACGEDTADSIGNYADGENLAMVGEKNRNHHSSGSFCKIRFQIQVIYRGSLMASPFFNNSRLFRLSFPLKHPCLHLS